MELIREVGMVKGYGGWLVGAAALASLGAMVLGFRQRPGPPASESRLGDVMVGDIVAVDPDATLIEAAKKMREANVGVLPIISQGRLRGLITDRDIVLRAVANGADPALTTVGECATRDIVCARRDTPVAEAMEAMKECQVGRLPVVDDDNHVVGMVTLSSLALRADGQGQTLQTAQEVSRRSARAGC